MQWRFLDYDTAVDALRAEFGFDFTTIGLAPHVGAPLRWVYASGASGNRYCRIVLSPGHGVGGIVLKAGRPMLFTNIDAQLDPRKYSSYPIIFAEDLRSFCALPLVKASIEGESVHGVLVCAFRSTDASHKDIFARLFKELEDGFCNFSVRCSEFINLNGTHTAGPDEQATTDQKNRPASGEVAIQQAQESERRRISRELHDGLAQELLSVSMLIRQAELKQNNPSTDTLLTEAQSTLRRLMDDIHKLSVELRPLALDDLGLSAALRAQAQLYCKTFGPQIDVVDETNGQRFPHTIETHAYRIAQEALLNACKYSQSDHISVHIATNNTHLLIHILDTGCGFDVAHPPIRGHGCGLAGMKERARSIDGTLDITSNERGTQVVLRIPTPTVTQEESAVTQEGADSL